MVYVRMSKWRLEPVFEEDNSVVQRFLHRLSRNGSREKREAVRCSCITTHQSPHVSAQHTCIQASPRQYYSPG